MILHYQAVSVQRKKPRANGKKKAFSPKGIQSGQLQFRAIPITDAEDTPYRYPKRTRFKPLAYWKGEKVDWGRNDFPEEMQQNGLLNMAVPKSYKKVVPCQAQSSASPKATTSVVKKTTARKKTHSIGATTNAAATPAAEVPKKQSLPFVDEELEEKEEEPEIRVGEDYQAVVMRFLSQEDPAPTVVYDGTEGDVLWDPTRAQAAKEEGQDIGKPAQYE